MLALCTLPDGRLLSGAGDGTVGVWRRPVSSAVSSAGFVKESECRVQTVVRGLAPYSGGFAQVGNDGVETPAACECSPRRSLSPRRSATTASSGSGRSTRRSQLACRVSRAGALMTTSEDL